MLNKLTKKQLDSIPKFVEEFVAKTLEETKDTDSELEKKWQTIYEDIGLSKPRVIVCRKGIEEFVSNINKWNKESQVWSQVRSQVWSQVGLQVGSQVWSQVGLQVRSQVWSQVRSQVWSQVGSQVLSQVWSQVGSQVWSQVWSQVGSQEYYLADYVAFNKFFVDKISLPKDILDSFNKYTELIRGTTMCYFTDEVCIVLTKPKVRTSNGLTHSDEFPAIEWKDGTKLHFLNGVLFPEDLWKRVVSREMPFQDILAIEDIDQRTQAMKYGNIHDFFKHQNGKMLDTYKKQTLDGVEVKYELWEIPANDTFTKKVHFAVYDCPSTGKLYCSGVPEFETVPEAMAWKESDDEYTVTPEMWKSAIPLVHES